MAGHRAFADGLKMAIERRYRDAGYRLGWRLLYSPAAVLEGARVALVGLNPGGRVRPNDHAEFAMVWGSAYMNESWKGRPPGTAPLQKQVLSLFEMLDERPEDVLAGNLVPFRSPSWNSLPGDRKAAVAFGKDLWRDMVLRARPSLVVAIGKHPFDSLREALGAAEPEEYGLNWHGIAGRRCVWPGGELVGLPHLSRYSVVTAAATPSGMSCAALLVVCDLISRQRVHTRSAFSHHVGELPRIAPNGQAVAAHER